LLASKPKSPSSIAMRSVATKPGMRPITAMLSARSSFASPGTMRLNAALVTE